MRTLIAVGLFVAVLSANDLSAQIIDKIPVGDIRTPSPDIAVQQPVQATIPQRVIGLYDALADMSHAEQKHALLSVTPAVRAQLWMYNLLKFQERHPEMLKSQADAIAAGIELVGTPHLFDAMPGSPEFAHTSQVIAIYGKWAASVLPPGLFYSALMNLGADEPMATVPATTGTGAAVLPSSRSFIVRPTSSYPCECATTTYISGWDCFANSHGVSCVPAPDLCAWHIGCGVFGTDTCTGFCV